MYFRRNPAIYIRKPHPTRFSSASLPSCGRAPAELEQCWHGVNKLVVFLQQCRDADAARGHGEAVHSVYELVHPVVSFAQTKWHTDWIVESSKRLVGECRAFREHRVNGRFELGEFLPGRLDERKDAIGKVRGDPEPALEGTGECAHPFGECQRLQIGEEPFRPNTA